MEYTADAVARGAALRAFQHTQVDLQVDKLLHVSETALQWAADLVLGGLDGPSYPPRYGTVFIITSGAEVTKPVCETPALPEVKFGRKNAKGHSLRFKLLQLNVCTLHGNVDENTRRLSWWTLAGLLSWTCYITRMAI